MRNKTLSFRRKRECLKQNLEVSLFLYKASIFAKYQLPIVTLAVYPAGRTPKNLMLMKKILCKKRSFIYYLT
jgi:hypothetical protein